MVLSSTAHILEDTNPATPEDHMARVLIVEDEPHTGRLLAKALASRGHDTVVVDTGRAGHEAAVAQPPDLMLLDLTLPDVDGLDVLAAVRADDPLVPVLVVSGRTDSSSRGRAAAAGAFGFVTKPFRVAHLLECVDAALGGTTSPGHVPSAVDPVWASSR